MPSRIQIEFPANGRAPPRNAALRCGSGRATRGEEAEDTGGGRLLAERAATGPVLTLLMQTCYLFLRY